MKKVAVSLAAAGLTFGIATTGVSAEEYEVERGDTLGKIANKYQTSVDEIMKMNELNDTVIHPKQVLNLDEKTDEQNEKTYEVEKGDTLSELAVEHDVSVKSIKKWNDLSSNLIIVGEKITLKKVKNEQQVQEDNEDADEDETKEVHAEVPADESNEEASESESEPEYEEKQAEEKENNEEPQANQESSEHDENNEPKANSEQDDDKEQSEDPEGETISASATAYTAECDGCSGVTATGENLNDDPNAKVIAVDPDVIPLGSEVYVEGYGYARAEDTGGDINGNRVDLHVPSKDEAREWGSQDVEVTVVE